MPWDMTYHNTCPESPRIGDCWPDPAWLTRTRDGESMLGTNYFRDWADKRPPITVALPGPGGHPDWFCIDRKASDGKHDRGWEVRIDGPLAAGQKPNITITPSINCVGSYHGYITAGVISDDCEGRKFEGQA